MRTVAGLRNAVLAAGAILALHYVIVRHASGHGQAETKGQSPAPARQGCARRPSGHHHPQTSTMLSDIAARSRAAARASCDWPPPPPPAPGTGGRREQRPYTLEDDERAALHRLVFSQEGDGGGPSLRPPDCSELHVPAEGAMTNELPMFHLEGACQPAADGGGVSGISCWGAGYQPLHM